MIDRFLGRIGSGPLLLDAAMGTRLLELGLDLAIDSPCLWSLTRPDAVAAVHRRDVAAGAEAVFTNTFGANESFLAHFARGRDAAEVNRAAVRIAREVAGPDRFVIGSIGPTVVDAAAINAQADLLLAGGVDALVLETFRFDQAIEALGWLGRPGRPVLVGLFEWPEPIADHARRLLDAGATTLGANCFDDLGSARRFLAATAAIGDPCCWLKPSTGLPANPTLSPADFAALAGRLAETGTGLLGGCCGTTELHLAAIRSAWDRDDLLAKRAPGC